MSPELYTHKLMRIIHTPQNFLGFIENFGLYVSVNMNDYIYNPKKHEFSFVFWALLREII